MARARFAILVCAAFVFGVASWASEPQAEPAKTGAVDQVSAQAVEQQAEKAGVVVGRMFEFDLARAQFASQLLEKGVSGATCQVVCPRNRVGGISCPVGQPCQCSCPGDYPDCTCRP